LYTITLLLKVLYWRLRVFWWREPAESLHEHINPKFDLASRLLFFFDGDLEFLP
jgi:abortive infection bacteriophage resistance protein